MLSRIEELKSKLDAIYEELEQELAHKREEFQYSIEQGKVKFEEATKKYHRTLRMSAWPYVITAPVLYLLTSPFIYMCIIPFALVDLFLTIYQRICFPVYKIPQVKRSQYLKHDRHKLNYLNIIEKINCEYCAYGNGVLAYATEIAGRTELFWCPIKHATTPRRTHERYDYFMDYGDSEAFERKLEERRAKCRACDDCKSCG